MKKYHCCAIIPALNEENTLEKVLQDTKQYVQEIIVIDDGSTDNTFQIAQKYAYVIKHEQPQGYDQSLNDGFKAAQEHGADIIITLDADGQHLAEDIPTLINPIILGEADVVVGKRPYRARLMETVFAHYIQRFEYGISDPLCGMKAYNIKIYNEIGFFDTITSIGTQLALTVCKTASKRGYKVKEVPIQLQKREDTPRFGRKLKANYKLLKAYLRVRRYLGGLSKN